MGEGVCVPYRHPESDWGSLSVARIGQDSQLVAKLIIFRCHQLLCVNMKWPARAQNSPSLGWECLDLPLARKRVIYAECKI